MARRGTSKRRSVDHEDCVASYYRGTRSASSGAAAHDAGDVRAGRLLIECKSTGTPEKPARGIRIDLDTWEKACEEAYAEGREPLLALRITTDSPYARDGHVDLVARFLRDDPRELAHG